jgi:hypothetical protein
MIAGFAQGQQNTPPAAQPDIVRVLMPEDISLRKVPAGNVPKEEAIQRLNDAKKQAGGKRLQKISYLLCVLGGDYNQNRDYLVRELSKCTAQPMKAPCDEDTGAYLINLYRRGHQELLGPLLDAGKTSHAALDEILGSFYSGLITHSATAFVNGIKTRPAPEQKNLCYMAGAADGSGMPPEDLSKARKAFRTMNTPVAKACLEQIERANKKL